MNVFIARFDMLSWWHVGTGEGVPGGSDSRQAVEAGIPIIPSTFVKGIARDAGRVVADILGGGASEVADGVFGTPRSDGRWNFGTARPVGEVPVIADSDHNRVDPETGTVADTAFFNAQVVGGGTFESLIETNRENVDDRERALIAASLLALERLGRRQSRGWGRCRVTLHDLTPERNDISASMLASLEEVAG